MEQLKLSELEILFYKDMTPVMLIARVMNLMSGFISASEMPEADKESFSLLESIAVEALEPALANEKKYTELLKTKNP